MELLGVLLLLGIPALAIWRFVQGAETRTKVAMLETRMASLEARLGVAPQDITATWRVAEPPPQPATPAAQPRSPLPPETPIEAAQPNVVAAVPPQHQPPAAPPLAPAGPGLEERLGTRWVVWVGGLALALGGIFLVRYSIEQGLVGPGVRIALSALLAAALIAAGEWTRRHDNLAGFAQIPSAHIPSILTAAGTAVAYATIYAAYALYGFLGPATAFILLGIVALLTLGAALLHGAALAALGLVGAEVAPLLVSSAEPDYFSLYLYLAVVTAAAFCLARTRLWRWLAVTAIAFGVLWTLPGLFDLSAGALGAHIGHVLIGFGLVAVFIVAGLFYGPETEPGRVDAVSSGALIAYTFAAALIVTAHHHETTSLIAFSVLVAATVAIAWRTEAAVAAVPGIALMTALIVIAWVVRTDVPRLVMPGGPTAAVDPIVATSNASVHITLGFMFAALFGLSGYFAQGRYERALAPVLWAASGALAPLTILIALYYRTSQFEQSVPYALIALLLAGSFAFACEALSKREHRPGLGAAAAIYAAASTAGLALSLTFALDKGWLTIGLALMVPGIAWVSQQRSLPMLRQLCAVLIAIVLARVAWEPRIVGDDIGTTPIFNWLLYGYGVPALAFWIGGMMLRRRADDTPARMVDAAAILFTVLTAFLEIRHYMSLGDIYQDSTELAEIALQVSVGLALTIGLERLRGRTDSVVHDVGAQIIAAMSLAGIVFGLLLMDNPFWTDVSVGAPFINLILLGYGLPAVLATILALIARTTRPMPYRAVAAATAVVLAITYLSLQVARLYHGPVLTDGDVTDAEQYTYSAVWLVFGVVLLLTGLILQSKPARLASAAVLLLTVAKVFLIDMSDLTGLWRSLSFIGLGLVLVGIGYLYQRLLFPPHRLAAEATPSPG